MQVSAIQTITKQSDQSRYTTWWSVPSYLDCRVKPCVSRTHLTPPWRRASRPKSGLSAHSRRGPLCRVADAGGPKISLSYRLNRQATKCGEPQESRRRSIRSSLHTSRPGWRSPRPRPGDKCSPPPGVPASVRPGKPPPTCSPSLRGQHGIVRITRRRMELWMAARTHHVASIEFLAKRPSH